MKLKLSFCRPHASSPSSCCAGSCGGASTSQRTPPVPSDPQNRPTTAGGPTPLDLNCTKGKLQTQLPKGALCRECYNTLPKTHKESKVAKLPTIYSTKHTSPKRLAKDRSPIYPSACPWGKSEPMYGRRVLQLDMIQRTSEWSGYLPTKTSHIILRERQNHAIRYCCCTKKMVHRLARLTNYADNFALARASLQTSLQSPSARKATNIAVKWRLEQWL